MNHHRTLSAATALVFAFTIAACGGGEQAGGQDGSGQEMGGEMSGQQSGQQAQQMGGELTMPDWITVDEANQTVTLDIVAGQTDANNSWNFNGHANGEGTVVVPQGFEVTVDFENADQVNPHSIGVDTRVGGYPPVFQAEELAFEGAVTEGALEMASATQPGESESFTFTASDAGEYALVCYVPAHAAQGMWLHFVVSAEGEAGFRQSGG